MLPRALESATCVQRFDDSLNSAIRITYRISLRSSSLRGPRYPLLTVVRFPLPRRTCYVVEALFNLVVIKGHGDPAVCPPARVEPPVMAKPYPRNRPATLSF